VSADLAEAGLAEAATILPGDARRSLTDLPGPIGLVLPDGWKDLSIEDLAGGGFLPRLGVGGWLRALPGRDARDVAARCRGLRRGFPACRC
jgi:hypothetical protein